MLPNLVTINLLLLSILDCRYKSIPRGYILTLFVLVTLQKPHIFSCLYITVSSLIMYSRRKIQLGDVLVLSLISILIPLHKLTKFLLILTLSSLIMSLIWRFVLSDPKAPMIPCILMSWLLT